MHRPPSAVQQAARGKVRKVGKVGKVEVGKVGKVGARALALQ